MFIVVHVSILLLRAGEILILEFGVIFNRRCRKVCLQKGFPRLPWLVSLTDDAMALVGFYFPCSTEESRVSGLDQIDQTQSLYVLLHLCPSFPCMSDG